MGCGATGGKVTPGQDPWIIHAQQIIFADYGEVVTLEAKNKDLLKFGRHEKVQTTLTTLMTLPASIYNETYVASNLITHAISTDAGDTEVIRVEGHTVVGVGADAKYTFVTQDVTLTGQDEVPLGTPLARCSRVYNLSATPLAGLISITEVDTYSAGGEPVTASKVHTQIRAGQQQTEKCSTTIEDHNYWVITGWRADLLAKTAAFAEVVLEIRRPGEVFRPFVTASINTNDSASQIQIPYVIVPANADIRMRAAAGANDKDCSGWICGALMTVA
jgi:hypothetical protein